MNQDPKVAIIGAGCSGLTAIKHLIQAGVRHITCFEKNGQVGGTWIYTARESHSSVCETTHIISSKKQSEFSDFPMPDHYPDYPSHQQVLDYFRAYADRFKLRPYIRFNTPVHQAQPLPDGRWELSFGNPRMVQVFDYLIIANGHHSKARVPKLPGNFSGRILHTHQYKTNRDFQDERVLVVGAGNSGCDCAVEISRVAKEVSISMRRAYYIVPKFMMGRPTDTFNGMLQYLPRAMRSYIQRWSLRFQIGDYRRYGLQNPDYPINSCHPVVNSELLYKIRHGKVHPRQGIQRVEDQTVTFADGHREEFDTILYATGYQINFPFFDKKLIDYSEADRIELYLRMFHPEHSRLFFLGLVQPQGSVWPIAEQQAKLVGNYIAGRCQLPENIAELAKHEADQIARDFINSKRHALEVHFHPFLQKIKSLIPKDSPEWDDSRVPTAPSLRERPIWDKTKNQIRPVL